MPSSWQLSLMVTQLFSGTPLKVARTTPSAGRQTSMTAEPPRGAVKEFLTWIVGDEGQAVVRRSGYVALRAAAP